MKRASEIEARAAVHIAATVMRAAGLCKMAEAFNCKRSAGQREGRFNTCVDCIERWLYQKARQRVSVKPKSESGWISVDQRLPRSGSIVVVMLDRACRATGLSVALSLYHDGFCIIGENELTPHVTFWSPIPQP